MYMLRFTRTNTLELPAYSGIWDRSGASFFCPIVRPPVSQGPFFQPTEDQLASHKEPGDWIYALFHLGRGRTSVTAHSLGTNLFTLADSTPAFGDRNDPGDRKSGFEFSYRVPGLRNWLTIYSDSYSDDDPSPLANTAPGRGQPRAVRIASSALPKTRPARGGGLRCISGPASPRRVLLYFNTQYHDANVNQGNLFGNPTGRDGRSYQLGARIVFQRTAKLQFTRPRRSKPAALHTRREGRKAMPHAFLWRVRPGGAWMRSCRRAVQDPGRPAKTFDRYDCKVNLVQISD